jgi:hypothetical protein
MLKKWFTPAIEEELAQPSAPVRTGPAERVQAAGGPAEEPAPMVPAVPAGGAALGKYNAFEQIYQNATTKPPRLPYNILKVAEMVDSSHLATMSADAKRCSLLMALEAAGAAVEDVLQDAVIRQKALADYEEAQRTRLKNFEQQKAEENNKIQAELERLTGVHMARIQSNLDEVAREQTNFRAWQKSKNQESQRITEAAAYCVPQGSPVGATSLAGVLERATLTHQ